MPEITKFFTSGGMIRLSANVYVSIFSFFALFFFVISQGVSYSAVFISAILMHESAHICFLCLFKAQIRRVTVFPFGIDIYADTFCLSYKKELICTLAGSLANFLAGVIACCLFTFIKRPLILFFILCSFFLGAMNLIPLSFFDGGKAVQLIVYDAFDIDTAYGIYRCFEIASGIFFLAVSLFLIKASLFNASVILVVIYASAASLFWNTRKPVAKA